MDRLRATLPAPVRAGEILRVCIGSELHGMAVDGTDDHDEMAIFLEPFESVVGIHQGKETYTLRTQPEGKRSQPGDVDLTYHSLRKFLRLVLKGNPTLLNILFVPDGMDGGRNFIMNRNEVGFELQQLAPFIISKRCGWAYLGYLLSQKRRMVGEQGQKDVKRPELVEKYGYDTKYAGHALRLGYQGIELMQFKRLTFPSPMMRRLRNVRKGELSYDEVLQSLDTLIALFPMAIADSGLPEVPDESVVEAFLRRVYKEWWANDG